MMTFLKTVLIVLLVYYGLKLLLRFLMPYMMRSLARKVSRKFGHSFEGGGFGSDTTTPEGQVSIDSVPQEERKSKTTVGEYVDYEEID